MGEKGTSGGGPLRAIVITRDQVCGQALAHVCRARGIHATVREPRGEPPADDRVLVLDLTTSGPSVAAWSGLPSTSARLVALGGSPDLLPDGVDVWGWVTPDSSIDTFLAVLLDVARGQRHPFGLEWSQPTPPADPLMELTPREAEVLAELLYGHGVAAIGQRLRISDHTVRTHVQNVLSKLGVNSRAEAAAYALRHGLVDDRAGRASA